MQNIYESVGANKRKSLVVIFGFVVFVTVAVYFISKALSYYWGYPDQIGASGLGLTGIALIISGVLSFVGYYFSDKIVLGISGARPASRKSEFDFYTVAENLAIGAGLSKPKLYVIEDSAPNAFATGRDPEHAVVCATTGLLSKLNRTELEGVIAHELSHIKNYDTRLMSVVAVLVGLIALIADWFLRISWRGKVVDRDRDGDNSGAIFMVIGMIFAILSPIIAQLIQLAISRRREFLADASSVTMTRQPSGLIAALEKISGDTEALEAANKATAHMYIVNPFQGKRDPRALARLAGLFNTHPPISDRIKALKGMV